MTRLREFLLLLALAAWLVLPTREPERPVAGPPALPTLVESTLALTPRLVQPNSVATIHGVRPGMTRVEVEKVLMGRMGAGYRSEECVFEPWECLEGEHCRPSLVVNYGKLSSGPSLTATYDYDNRLEYLSGNSLELDGVRVLSPDLERELVETTLGPPDSQGCLGVGMCEGPFGGYRYESLRLTVRFSWNDPHSYILSSECEWLPEPENGYHF